MALRVLLADNSETIKKVMNLSLQDFGAEVKIVNVGIDVLDVAKSFVPEIIFVDVLLQQKNGYDVCKELKLAPETKNIPIVLMWSSFMDLDSQKAAECGANARLEKPFDSEKLRSLVTSLVKKAAQNPMAAHLKVPEVNKTDFEKEMRAVPVAPSAPPAPRAPLNAPQPPPVSQINPQIQQPVAPAPTMAPKTPGAIELGPTPIAPQNLPPTLDPIHPDGAADSWSMDSFEDISAFEAKLPAVSGDPSADDSDEDFKNVPLGSLPPQSGAAAAPLEVKGFEIDIPEDDFDGVTVNFVEPSEEIQDLSFLNLPVKDGAKPVPPRTPAQPSAPKAEAHAAPPKKETPPVQGHSGTATVPASSTEPKFASTATAGSHSISSNPSSNLSSSVSMEEQRRLIEEAVARIAREVIKEMVPDLATRVIREEIDRLLSEPESNL